MLIYYCLALLLSCSEKCVSYSYEKGYLAGAFDSSNHRFQRERAQMGGLGMYIENLNFLKCKRVFKCKLKVGFEGKSSVQELRAMLLHSEDERYFEIVDTISVFESMSVVNIKFKPGQNDYVAICGRDGHAIILGPFQR